MIAAFALMNLTAQAAYPELCLGLGRPISAVRINIRRRIGFVQKPIEFLTVMHARVGHVILPDQLVPGIGIHMVLVSIEALTVLLGPARILVFLPVFRRLFLPGRGCLPGLRTRLPEQPKRRAVGNAILDTEPQKSRERQAVAHLILNLLVG